MTVGENDPTSPGLDPRITRNFVLPLVVGAMVKTYLPVFPTLVPGPLCQALAYHRCLVMVRPAAATETPPLSKTLVLRETVTLLSVVVTLTFAVSRALAAAGPQPPPPAQAML